MKKLYSFLCVAIASLCATPSALAAERSLESKMMVHDLSSAFPKMHRLDLSQLPEQLRSAKTAPVNTAKKAVSNNKTVTYNWALMNGNATFHDDYCLAEFNLPAVDYPTGILYATNAADIYALRPYGNTYPYYADLVESGMVNTNAGAMTVDATDYAYVSIPMFVTGTTITWDDGTTEDIHMASLNWVMEFLGHDKATVKNSGLGGVNESGHIYFPCKQSIVFTTPSILSEAEKAGDILQGFYACDLDGLWGFYLPGVSPDDDEEANSLTLSTPQYCFNDNQIVLHMKAGSNIKIFKLGTYSAYTDDIFDDVIANGTAGEYLAEGDITINASGSAVGNNKIYIAVVAGDAQGNIKNADVIETYLVPNDDEYWSEPFKATLTDGIVAPMYTNFEVKTHDVEFQRAISNPGYIRVVNPYSNPWAYASACVSFAHHSHNHYLYINATDPSAVVLETSPLGLIVDKAEGEAKVSSYAAYNMDFNGKTLAEVKAAGHTGTLADNTITFPAKSLVYANALYKNGQYFNTNPNGEFALKLTDVLAVDNIAADNTDNADATYFDLQGRQVKAGKLNPGLYIRVAGGKSAKVLVK